ncbi:MAG: hypothetical protein FWD69_19540 [Polyangiaceae bacterium]|nr:hypothetical protein [Polyangiaceae bacterium]
MLSEKLARLVSEFTSQVFAALRNISLEELTALAQPPSAGSRSPTPKTPAKKTAATTAAQTRPPRPKATPKANAALSAPPPAPPEGLTEMQSALEYFAERRDKGATVHQLETHLASLGFVPSAGLIDELLRSGDITDAGFRRAIAAGKTGAVYVARTPPESSEPPAQEQEEQEEQPPSI